MHEEAIAEFQKSADLSGGSANVRSVLASAYAVSGKRAEAEKILEELKGQAKRGNLSSPIATI